MKKKKPVFLALLVFSVVAFALYWWYQHSMISVPESEERQLDKSDSLKPSRPVVASDEFPLKHGSRGARVSKVQEWINKKLKVMYPGGAGMPAGATILKVDGVWGDKTDASLRIIVMQMKDVYSYQKDDGSNDTIFPKQDMYPAIYLDAYNAIILKKIIGI